LAQKNLDSKAKGEKIGLGESNPKDIESNFNCQSNNLRAHKLTMKDINYMEYFLARIFQLLGWMVCNTCIASATTHLHSHDTNLKIFTTIEVLNTRGELP